MSFAPTATSTTLRAHFTGPVPPGEDDCAVEVMLTGAAPVHVDPFAHPGDEALVIARDAVVPALFTPLGGHGQPDPSRSWAATWPCEGWETL